MQSFFTPIIMLAHDLHSSLVFSITGVIVFVDHRFNVVELSIQPDIIRKAIKKVKKRPKDGHTVKAVCVLKR